jgi:GTP:adenosylcobinamide-phosphate guanylyltransferase
MEAVVIAGGKPAPGEPLYPDTQGKYKALLDIAGKPMIQWVLDALSGSKCVEKIILVGLEPDAGPTSAKPIIYLPDQHGMLENIRSGVLKALEINPKSYHILTVSSDIPGITPEIVDWVADTAMQTDHDVYYNVITRQTMEGRYPGSRRSFVRLKDIEVCGGDLNVIRSTTIISHEDLVKRLVDARKSALKQAALLGFDTLFMLLFHLVTLKRAEEIASQRLGVKGRAVVCPYAEVGMDVDKPFQLEIMRRDLEGRTAK